MTYRAPLAITLALALAACTSEPAEPEPEPLPTATIGETPVPEESEGVSIIREDSDVAQEIIRLQPLETRISFDQGGSDLSGTAIAELEAVLETRQFKAGGAIVLSGHTDTKGTDAANMRAAQNRAEAVRDWLVAKNVPLSRITVIAIGEQNPARPNARPDGSPDEEGRAFNRRVDVVITVPAELAGPNPEDEAPTLVEQVSTED
ncbi:OmpA family protein [Pontixanthobacter sp. CEM42]|uniref:OmpA family protein n=1 Tax=Pontixanthobacter sp. CEM42 TaxID=2792077 RepID=UPI001ADF76B0|nr:OmpA family protein [Pontixanthobacter sp. CEM42]